MKKRIRVIDILNASLIVTGCHRGNNDSSPAWAHDHLPIWIRDHVTKLLPEKMFETVRTRQRGKVTRAPLEVSRVRFKSKAQILSQKWRHFFPPVSLVRFVLAGEPTDLLGCTDNLCILWSSAMGTLPLGTNGWNCWPSRPLGAQPMAPYSVEVTRIPYALPHATHKWWNPQRLTNGNFIFNQFLKVKAPENLFSCLRDKPAQITSWSKAKIAQAER